MGQMKLATASAGRIEPGWVIQEVVILEREKEELAKEKKKLEEAKSEFDKNGISIPFDQLEIKIHKDAE